MRRLLTDAIVVRVVDYGETDRVATLLTRAAGKVSALARGARASRRRYGSALALFGAGEAHLVERRGELWRLDGFDARRGYPHLALDVGRMAHAAYACELARELSPDHGVDEPLFDLLDEMLGLLDAAPPTATRLRVFELRLLAAVGLAPALDRCPGCGARPGDGDETWLDPRRGGLLCGPCGAGAPLAVPAPARRALLEAQRARLVESEALAVAPAAAAAARDVVQALLREHVGKPLRSVEFIAKLRGQDGA